MRLLCSSFVLESISHSNHIIRNKAYLFSSKFKIGNWERVWSQVTFLNTETPANQFSDKSGIGDITHQLPNPRLTFIADVSHTVAEMDSIIFDMLFLQTQNLLN